MIIRLFGEEKNRIRNAVLVILIGCIFFNINDSGYFGIIDISIIISLLILSFIIMLNIIEINVAQKFIRTDYGIFDQLTIYEIQKMQQNFLEDNGYTYSLLNLYENEFEVIIEKDNRKIYIKTIKSISQENVDALEKRFSHYYSIVNMAKYLDKVQDEKVKEVPEKIISNNVDEAIVITNGFFTKKAIEFAKNNNINLWERRKIISFMNNTEK